MYTWICFHFHMFTFQLAGTLSGQTAFDKLERRAALCRGEEPETSQFDAVEGTDLELKRENTECQMKKQVEVEGAGGMAPLDWRVRTGPPNKPTQKEWEDHEATHVSFWRLVRALHDGQRTHEPPRHQTKE